MRKNRTIGPATCRRRTTREMFPAVTRPLVLTPVGCAPGALPSPTPVEAVDVQPADSPRLRLHEFAGFQVIALAGGECDIVVVGVQRRVFVVVEVGVVEADDFGHA